MRESHLPIHPGDIDRISSTTLSTLSGFTVSIAPISNASSSRLASRSMEMMSVHPFRLAAMMATEPTPPVPKIAIDEPACAFNTLMTAPAPVWIPHPRGPSNSSSTSSPTGTAFRSDAIAYVANDDCPKKRPPISSPSSEIGDDPSTGRPPRSSSRRRAHNMLGGHRDRVYRCRRSRSS